MERHALSGALLDTERAPSNIRALFILFKMLGGGGGAHVPLITDTEFKNSTKTWALNFTFPAQCEALVLNFILLVVKFCGESINFAAEVTLNLFLWLFHDQCSHFILSEPYIDCIILPKSARFQIRRSLKQSNYVHLQNYFEVRHNLRTSNKLKRQNSLYLAGNLVYLVYKPRPWFERLKYEFGFELPHAPHGAPRFCGMQCSHIKIRVRSNKWKWAVLLFEEQQFWSVKNAYRFYWIWPWLLGKSHIT